MLDYLNFSPFLFKIKLSYRAYRVLTVKPFPKGRNPLHSFVLAFEGSRLVVCEDIHVTRQFLLLPYPLITVHPRFSAVHFISIGRLSTHLATVVSILHPLCREAL